MDFITPAQCRAARGLLNWSQPDLSRQCKIHVQTISNFEHETSTPTKRTLERIKMAFENHGVEFLENNGTRQHKHHIREFEGMEGFRAFMDDVYHFASTKGGKISIINGSTDTFIEWLGEDWYAKHAARMEKVKNNFNFRIITRKQSREIGAAFATYKTLPGKEFSLQAIYLFGDHVGLFNFGENTLKIFMIIHHEISETLHYMFDLMWSKTE